MLRKLTNAFGVSGCETEVRDIIIEEIKDCGADFRIDNMGNLVAFKKAKKENAKTVLLSAHMDEVGFIVTDITEDGYIKFETVGGIDARILISKRVKVNGRCGVIGLKPVHLASKEERKKMPKANELFVDIGAKDRTDAESVASKGDYFGFDSEYIEFGEMIKAKALDDRLGCAIMIEILKKEWDVNLVCTFNVQEEVGLRGAKIAAKGARPDFALVIEGTTCNDLPTVPKNLRVTKSGDGAAISVLDSASKADRDICDMLIKAAEKRNISWQYKASTAGGNDAGAISLLEGGIKTASISVPCRYIHSPVSVMHKSDFESCKELVEGFLEDCGKELTEND
ncbi:MAG: M42 family metallopeptidase [Clostridia bacterium]|nr:M42 family metallopeptidase [Clostridia bacterium]